MVIRYLFSLFIGALVATLIGVGISAFYPGPVQPQAPTEISAPAPDKTADMSAEKAFEHAQKDYEKAQQHYSLNVAAIALGLSVILVILSLTVLGSAGVITDGLLTGGLITLVYAVIRGAGSQNQRFLFLVTLVGLGLAVTVGIRKFSHQK
jgi:hypothetical protein